MDIHWLFIYRRAIDVYRAVAQTIILAARKKRMACKKEQQKKDFSVLRGTKSRYVELHRKFVMRQGRCFCKPRVCD